jgi:hypothetical protein
MKNSTIFVDSSIAIDCLNVCSLSFLSLALLEEKRKKILFFSSQNYLLVKSELNHLKIHSKIYKDFQERVEFVFLKKTYTQVKDDFLKDFEAKVASFEDHLIYFDRIDYFLDLNSYTKYEKVFREIKKIVEKYQKKIIYIYSSKSSNHTYLDKAIKKNMTKLDFMNRDNKEKTMPSLHALQEELLEEKSSPKSSLLEPISETKIQVMLMSDNDELKKLHYYIFSSAKDVDYYTIDILPEDEMSLLSEMDIIIFNKKNIDLKYDILKYIKTHNLSLKFFEITNNEYLRQKDLLMANLDGVDKLFKRDFLMEDFVMSIEMYLKSSFYSKRLLSLPQENQIIMTKKELFEKKIDALINKKIFFSLFTYHYEADADIESYNIQKIVREYDNIFINKRREEIHFLILNTIPDFGKELIQNRIQNFSIHLELKRAESAFDLIFD